jgi:hypothetical protein
MSESLFFKTTIGKFQGEEIKVIDEIRNIILDDYKEHLKNRPSLHEYIANTSNKLQSLVKKIRYSSQIKKQICSKYKQCDITTLGDTDELYISHYNIDGGGDQGLYDKHYDGVLRFINNATVVRVLVYINSNDDYVVHFLDSNTGSGFDEYKFDKDHESTGIFSDKVNEESSRVKFLLINFRYLH